MPTRTEMIQALVSDHNGVGPIAVQIVVDGLIQHGFVVPDTPPRRGQLSIHPTSCRCGGDLAWMVQEIDDPGAFVMVGCICHTPLDRLIEVTLDVDRARA